MTLVLLNLPPRQALAFGAAIVEKRATGEELAAELWVEYLGQEMECFACGAAVATPPAPFTMVPARQDARPDAGRAALP
jgi:hypothetical protein